MKIRYTVYDPTNNITLLAETPIPRPEHAAAAAELMRLRPEAEQVGFLEPPASPAARLRLQMMGGEFCGNATMSAAAYLAERDGLPAGQSAVYRLEVSGAEGVLACRIENRGAFFRGTVVMPLPEAIGEAVLPSRDSARSHSVPAVRFPGITHCIVPADAMTREQAETDLRALCGSLRTDACGILLFDERVSVFTPLVYVVSTDTAVWESGCGSGSAAIGAYLSARSGSSGSFRLRQPGGVMEVSVVWDGVRIVSLTISGEVRSVGGAAADIRL
jgi:diaminopimelate epimerase